MRQDLAVDELQQPIPAQAAWRAWRRIMREPALQTALLDGNDAAVDIAGWGFSVPEEAAALAYAAQADRAKWFVTNYRFRLVNSFINALEVGAPLTLRALLSQQVELPAIAKAFLDRHDWKDHGPFVYRYALDALAFLVEHPVVAPQAALRSLIGLERTVVELMVGLKHRPAAPAVAAGWIARTPMASHFSSEHRLSAWLRDKKSVGRTALAEGREEWLAYLPYWTSAHKLALLPDRAAQIYRALAEPRSIEGLAAALMAEGWPAHTAHDDFCIAALQRYGAIRLGGSENA